MPPLFSFWRHARVFGQGAVITLGSTVISCGLAIQIERSAHRFLYTWHPEWYFNVKQAYGLTKDDLLRARRIHDDMERMNKNKDKKESPSHQSPQQQLQSTALAFNENDNHHYDSNTETMDDDRTALLVFSNSHNDEATTTFSTYQSATPRPAPIRVGPSSSWQQDVIACSMTA